MKGKYPFGSPDKLKLGEMPDYANTGKKPPTSPPLREFHVGGSGKETKESIEKQKTYKTYLEQYGKGTIGFAQISVKALYEDDIEEIVMLEEKGIFCLIETLTWMLADIDFRNQGLVVRNKGLEKVEDSPKLAKARTLLKELEAVL